MRNLLLYAFLGFAVLNTGALVYLSLINNIASFFWVSLFAMVVLLFTIFAMIVENLEVKKQSKKTW